MTVIHWPTFADGLFWCACDNRTFPDEETWQDHVVDAVLAERGEKQEMECVDLDGYYSLRRADLDPLAVALAAFDAAMRPDGETPA